MLNREVDHTTLEPRSQIDSCSVISTRLRSAEMAEVERAARAAGLRKGDWLKAAVRAYLDLPEPTKTEPSYLIVLAQIAAPALRHGKLLRAGARGTPTARGADTGSRR